TTAALTTANSGDQYKVIVTDTGTSVATSVTSAARTLTVNTALNITTQPSTQAITLAGGSPTATFTVVAADGSPAYSYQWQFQSQGVGPFVNVGTNAASYTTAGLTLGNNNDVYQVIVTDSATVPTSVTSNTATLNVTALRATSPGQDFSNGAMSSKAWDSAAISPDQLTAISCPSTSFCMAVDTDGTAFRYDGLNWTSADKIDTGHSFKSVSCASSDHCIAVDNSGYAFLYNGTWSTGAQFDTSGEPVSVSCPNSSFCMVIDNNANAFAYNGATWSSAESVGIASDLTAVSCTSDTECVAVDAQGNSSRYDGTVWTAYSANPISSYGLNAVSCTPNSGSFCMAVDSAGNAFGYNGTTWSHQYDDGAIDSDSLNSVSCLGTAFCMVVDSNGGALRYNGVTWSAVSDIDGTHSISSLSCPTAAFCMGVDKAGNAWKYLASAANIAQANSGDDDAAEKTPVAQTFSVKARDNTAATYKITGLKQPEGVHIDTNNNLWIADEVGAKVYRLPASANGELSDNTPALVSITNSASMSPTSVVTDAEGNIYVADRDNAIFIYPAATYQTPGNYSDAVPSRTIAGEDTGLNTPLALALDSQHNIWVANQNGNSIEQFAAGTDGDSNSIKPTVTISGAKTLLEEPNGIFMDTMGNIWVTNAKVNKIYVFAAGTEGNAAPTCVITNEAINNPVGISLDSQGNIYQANDVESGGAINIFEPVSANCGTTTVSPMRHIAGVSTSIGKSLGLSIGYVF
ncbi:MAG: hypothetical protein KBB94_03820, partial [Legionellaceae bacterium]|nr:hypothetical protein [Legionellaceae bacterium]MBP9774204.1 hypothetical protein [Legionellaceae bacterium]